MTLSAIVFFGVTAFSVLLFAFAPEAPSLVLLFASTCALITSFFGFELFVCGAVFVVSFLVTFVAALIVSVAGNRIKRGK